MRHLVEGSGGLILGVARLGEEGEGGVVDGTVDDFVGGGDGVGEDVGLAVTCDFNC